MSCNHDLLKMCDPCCVCSRLENQRLKNELEVSNAAVRTAVNYRLIKEAGRSDWKEHLQRFDECVKAWERSRGNDLGGV